MGVHSGRTTRRRWFQGSQRLYTFGLQSHLFARFLTNFPQNCRVNSIERQKNVLEALSGMRASKAMTFILLTGVIFGLAAAAMSWINGVGLWIVFLAYIAGGNVGVSLAAALIYFNAAGDLDD